MTVVIELFYSPTCPHCPKAKETLLEVLEEVDQKTIQLHEVNALSPEGLERAEKRSITAVPAIIVDTRNKIVGRRTKDRLLRIINHEIMKEQIEGGKK